MRTLLAAACLVVSFPALAATPGRAPAPPAAGAIDWAGQADMVIAAVKPEMQLTDAQVEKLRPMLAAYLPKLRTLFDSYAGSGIAGSSSLITQFREARETFRQNIAPILDDTQMEKFLLLRQQVDAEIRKGFVDARLVWYRRTLDLDDAQAEKVRPIVADQFDKQVKIMSMHADSPVSPGAARAIDPELVKAKRETDARLRTVLTPEQMRTYLEAVNK